MEVLPASQELTGFKRNDPFSGSRTKQPKVELPASKLIPAGPTSRADTADQSDSQAPRNVYDDAYASETTGLRNTGHVARATSFAGMEEAARARGAKGVIWERGVHALGQDVWEQWVANQKAGVEGHEQLVVAAPPPGSGCGDPSHPCGKEAEPARAVAGPEEISAACKRATAKLPPPLREAVCTDAEALAAMLIGLCPDAPWLAIAVEIVGKDRCSRWHQDNYVGRAIVTYAGPGTWMADDKAVRYEQFRRTRGKPMEVSDPAIVPECASIHEAPTNAVALIKGNDWPGIRGPGLTHKSPNVPVDGRGRPEVLRVLLKVDLAGNQPGLPPVCVL